MEIKQKNSPNKMGRNNWIPDIIVFHITEGNYDGAVTWLCNSISKASANFVVSQKGEITQLIPLDMASWCNGTSTNLSTDPNRHYSKSTSKLVRDRKSNANYYTISIENEGFYTKTQGKLTEAQLKANIWLVGYIRTEIKRLYDIDIPIDKEHLLPHSAINPITKPNCCGELFQLDAIINAFREDLKLNKVTTKIKVNGIDKTIDGYNIDGFFNVKIRDLCDLLDATVGWDSVNTTVSIQSKK